MVHGVKSVVFPNDPVWMIHSLIKGGHCSSLLTLNCCPFLLSALFILCVNLTSLRDGHIVGKTLFLGVSVEAFPEDISI